MEKLKDILKDVFQVFLVIVIICAMWLSYTPTKISYFKGCIESTINIYMVNNRATSYPVASNDNVKNSLRRFFSRLRNGENEIISDDAIIQQFRNIDILGRNQKDGINDLLIARDKILEMYFREIGVKMYQPKKAQVNNEEVEANNQLLILSHDDMENSRREGVERVNARWGINIRVQLNERFNTASDGVREGDKDNETNISE